MRLISRRAGSHDPIPLHRIAPVRPVCLDRLCPDYEKRAARTIPLRRFCLFIFSRRRLCCRLDHVSFAAIEKLGTVEPPPKATLHTHVSYRITPVARACRATQRTYLDGVNGVRREARDGHRPRLVEDARCLKRTDRVVGAYGSRLHFVQLRTWDFLGRHYQLLGVAVIDTEDRCFIQRCLRSHRSGLGLETAFQHELHVIVTVRLNVLRELTQQTIEHAFCSSPRLLPYHLLPGPERQSLQSNHP